MSNQSQSITSNKIFIIVKTALYASLIILLENFCRDYLKNASKKYFFITEQTDCVYVAKANVYENGGKYFLLYLLFNYINVYSALFFVFINVFASYISSIVLLFTIEPRPYIDFNSQYPPCFDINTLYETPSGSIMTIYLSFATLYQAFIQKRSTSQRKIACIVIGIISLGYICYIKLLQNMIYLNQIILGLVFGYVIYVFFFEILEVQFNDFSQLKYCFKYIGITILIVLNLFLLIQYLNYKTSYNEQDFIIESQTKGRFNILIANSYYISIDLFELLGFYLAVLAEYILILKKNDDVFIRYNIKERNQNGLEMFNNTKNDISLFRFILFCLCQYYIQFSISESIIHSNSIQMIGKTATTTSFSFWAIIYSFPVFCHLHYGLVLFFGLKWLIRHFGLTNEKLFTSSLKDSELQKIFETNDK